MKIHEFANKYGVTKRSVDYWTTIGLLHPDIHENGYRDYSEKAESEIGYILIAELMNRPGSLKEQVEGIRNYDERQWKKCIADMQRKRSSMTEQFDIAYRIIVKCLEEA